MLEINFFGSLTQINLPDRVDLNTIDIRLQVSNKLMNIAFDTKSLNPVSK